MSFIDPVYDTLANQTLAGQELADALMGPTFMVRSQWRFGLLADVCAGMDDEHIPIRVGCGAVLGLRRQLGAL